MWRWKPVFYIHKKLLKFYDFYIKLCLVRIRRIRKINVYWINKNIYVTSIISKKYNFYK